MQLECGNEDNRTNLAVYSIRPARGLGGRILMTCLRILIWGTRHVNAPIVRILIDQRRSSNLWMSDMNQSVLEKNKNDPS